MKASEKSKEKIEITGINPFVFIPEKVRRFVFTQAGKDKRKNSC